MEANIKINSLQAMFLVIYTILPTAILFVPGITSSYSKNDAWISTILAGSSGVLVAFMSAVLIRKYPDDTVVQFSKKIFGKWLGTGIGFIYCLYFLYVAYFVQREFSDFMQTFVLPETPSIVVVSTFTILSAYGLYLGFEVLSRSTLLVGFIGFTALGLVMIFMTKDMKLEHLLPILGKTSVGNIVMGSFTPAGWLSECAIIMMFAPYMKNPQKSLKSTLWAVALLVLVMTLFVIGGITVFGHEILSRLNFPLFNIVIYMEPAEFLERIDPVFIAVWIMGMVMKFSIFYYAGILGLSQILQLHTYRPLLLPTGLLLTALSFISWENISDLKNFSRHVFPPSILGVNVGLTLLLVAGVWIRQTFKKTSRGKQ